MRVAAATTLAGAVIVPTWGAILHVPHGVYEAAHVVHIHGEPFTPPNFLSVQTVTSASSSSALPPDMFIRPLYPA